MSIQAKDIMTTQVVSILPDTQTHDIARLLLEHQISAVVVADADGKPIGMVSEGDLTSHTHVKQMEKREWWLNLLAEGEAVAPEFLDALRSYSPKAHEIMSSPVISVNKDTDISDIARLLTEYHIKRVPVVENGHIAGIVSRADLVKAIALQAAAAPHLPLREEPVAERKHPLLEAMQRRLHAAHAAESGHEGAETKERVSVNDFQKLVENFHHEKILQEKEARLQSIERHKKQIADIINRHVNDEQWQLILHLAREAAERGEKEYMLLRFPNELCTDGGRSISVGEDGWAESLRGEAAEIYLRWKQELRPEGFRIAARVLEYPGGFPGDIGLFLVWGQSHG